MSEAAQAKLMHWMGPLGLVINAFVALMLIASPQWEPLGGLMMFFPLLNILLLWLLSAMVKSPLPRLHARYVTRLQVRVSFGWLAVFVGGMIFINMDGTLGDTSIYYTMSFLGIYTLFVCYVAWVGMGLVDSGEEPNLRKPVQQMRQFRRTRKRDLSHNRGNQAQPAQPASIHSPPSNSSAQRPSTQQPPAIADPLMGRISAIADAKANAYHKSDIERAHHRKTYWHATERLMKPLITMANRLAKSSETELNEFKRLKVIIPDAQPFRVAGYHSNGQPDYSHEVFIYMGTQPGGGAAEIRADIEKNCYKSNRDPETLYWLEDKPPVLLNESQAIDLMVRLFGNRLGDWRHRAMQVKQGRS